MEITSDEFKHMGFGEITPSQFWEACIQSCLDCSRGCLDLVDHCLQLGGEYNQPGHIRQLLACSRVCEATAGVMLLKSSEHELLCKTCSEICFHTAEDFEVFGNDERMRFTANLARRCGEECATLETFGGTGGGHASS